MDCALLMVLSLVVGAWAWGGHVRCRLGLHVRPRGASSTGWVCRRCPVIHGAVGLPRAEDEDEVRR